MRCKLCGGQKLVIHRLEIRYETFDLCDPCADAVRKGKFLRAFDDLGCLHLMAMEIEQQCEVGFRPGVEEEIVRRTPSKVLQRLRQGWYRRECPCRTCEDVREDQVAVRPWPGRKPDPSRNVSPDEVPLDVLRTFNPDVVLIDRNGVEWTPKEFLRKTSVEAARKVTAHPGVIPGGLADQARDPAVFGAEMNAKTGRKTVWYHRPDRGGYSYGPVEPERRKIDDHLSQTWNADLRQFGKATALLRDLARRQALLAEWPHVHPGEQFGYYDGGYWVDATTGECFTLPKEW